MQSCLGIYLEENLIKYAKVSKDKTSYMVDNYGIKFFNGSPTEVIEKILEETYSYNVPISINLANEKYIYFDIFSLLSKKEIPKTVETEFEAYCDQNKYNSNAFETRYALAPNLQEADKLKAIDVIVNKIELNKQKQYVESFNLSKISPIGTAIPNVAKLNTKEKTIIVNMENVTTITDLYDKKIYYVETLDVGSQEVLEKINRVENSMSKAYEICKDTTIYTSDVLEDTKEQPYLEYIVPHLYKIAQRLQEIIKESPDKIDTIYLTGTLSVINNVDLYFQEFVQSTECKILKPYFLEKTISQVNIKDYIEVNSAIGLALFGLGEGIQSLNFKKKTFKDRLNQVSNVEIGAKKGKSTQKRKEFSMSLKGKLDKTEAVLLKSIISLLLIIAIFIIFSKMTYNLLDNKQTEVKGLISTQNAEIEKINKNTKSLEQKATAYKKLSEKLEAIDKKINKIERRKNAIPNLLNQIMYIIPETVQLTSITSQEDDSLDKERVSIVAQANDYDQLGYFIARIKLEGYLKNTISSSGQKSGNVVSVTIEGDLP